MKQAHIYFSFAAVLMAAACQTPQDRCAERQAPIVLKDGSVIHGDPIIAGDCVTPPLPAATVPPGSPPPPGGGGGGGGGNPPPDVDTDPEQSAAVAEAGSGAAAAAEQPNEISVASAQNAHNGGQGASAGAQQGNEVSGRF